MTDGTQKYTPDHRLRHMYEEANLVDPKGIEALCPAYVELAGGGHPYQNETLLGTGSLKEVWKCWDIRTRRHVAMARLRGDRGAEYYDLFVHEARIISSLNHPNIIKVYDLGIDEAYRPFFTMDLKGGFTLWEWINEDGMTTLREKLMIFQKICHAVAHAHERAVLHLDLKPDNIQVDRLGDVMVCDWGLAKCLDDDQANNEVLLSSEPSGLAANVTLHGEIRGTVGYMAPEQLVPGGRKDTRTDVFALGRVLYAMLVGQSPCTGEMPSEAISDEAQLLHERLSEKRIPESIVAVCLKACHITPEKRYNSALEIAEEVERYLSGFATAAEEPGFFRAAVLFVNRHRLPTAIATSALAGGLTLTILFVDRMSRERERTALERERAGVAAARYESHLEATTRSKRELSAQLAASANSLKNLGIFKSPVKTVSQAKKLLEVAHQLDPENDEARSEMAAIQCIQLDFQGVLQTPLSSDPQRQNYVTFAKAFPQFSFNNQQRPTPDQLADFFRRAYQIDPNQTGLMERILAYDLALRSGSAPFEPIAALVEYCNGGPDGVKLQYEPGDSRLIMHLTKPLRVNLWSFGGSDHSILSYLPIHTLVIVSEASVDIRELEGITAARLDVSGCPNLKIRGITHLPKLREIIFMSGAIKEMQLWSRIEAEEKFQIYSLPKDPESIQNSGR